MSVFVDCSVYEKMQQDVKEAMISKNNVKRDVLRMAISEIKNKTVNAGKEINDDVCISVVQKMVKQHEDSIEQFEKANRSDLVSREALELSYLKFYLPSMLNETETKIYLDNVLKENNIEPVKKNMGSIMKIVKTNRCCDAGLASKLLKDILV